MDTEVSSTVKDLHDVINKLTTVSMTSILNFYKVTIPAGSGQKELMNLITGIVNKESASWLKDLNVAGISKELQCADDQIIESILKEKSTNAMLNKFSDELLSQIITTCDLGENDPTKQEKIQKIEDETMMQGVNRALVKLDETVLKSIASDLKLTIPPKTPKDTLVTTVFDTLFEWEGDDTETTEKPVEKPPTPQKKTNKKPAAASKAKQTEEKPKVPKTVTPKKPAAKKVLTHDESSITLASSNRFDDVSHIAVGKRRTTTPVIPIPLTTKKPAASAPKTAAAKPKAKATKRKAEEMDQDNESDVSEDEEESEVPLTADDKKKGITKRNLGGGYYQDRKYVSPPISLIKKGYTAGNLSDWYNVDDLKEYCKENNLPRNLTKTKIIKNIVLFLNGKYVPKSKRITPKQRAALKKKEKEEALAKQSAEE
ncbi:myb domain-containing protein [Tieghemostelium lacteum]|uniref:Myb domain-containing protein n=1 Tax=Tieghemostelium lacteum TaxID=361077 RepID=A0A152A3Q9_TIELA|nr:myb domain-containing protein [Tieghemostelium lacteum]|eukprot:KYR00737.1 myb domain-containing protein [Tieghemostelium lacteum]